MKKILFTMMTGAALMSCGNATDGDARTDTTNFSVDTGGRNNATDTTNRFSTSTGEYPNDTIPLHNVKGDVRSSSPTSPDSRGTTPGNDSARRRQ